MPALESPSLDKSFTAHDFDLLATDGKRYRLEALKGEKGLLVAFLCNHCPYVKAVIERFVADAKEILTLNIGVVAIMANDTQTYPQDSFENMAIFARHHAFPFPYLYDETQATARAYDAVCTPDFFLFDKTPALVYRGRLDSGRMEPPPRDAKRELLEAARAVAAGRAVAQEQMSSIGCSIKWRET